ncbi:hypothetical protein C8R47DRAFT_1066691 [Mycena vitilis]|nr:hypothetical protein C8R47DRAFT_1066691 [Mycena vitilis]
MTPIELESLEDRPHRRRRVPLLLRGTRRRSRRPVPPQPPRACAEAGFDLSTISSLRAHHLRPDTCVPGAQNPGMQLLHRRQVEWSIMLCAEEAQCREGCGSGSGWRVRGAGAAARCIMTWPENGARGYQIVMWGWCEGAVRLASAAIVVDGRLRDGSSLYVPGPRGGRVWTPLLPRALSVSTSGYMTRTHSQALHYSWHPRTLPPTKTLDRQRIRKPRLRSIAENDRVALPRAAHLAYEQAE